MKNIHVEITPFLKWAGGKRWLVNNYSDLFHKDYNRYIEPFIGSGAVFFHLRPKKAIIADLNKDLINTYLVIKNDWQKLFKYLKVHQKKHSNEYYYEMRSLHYSDKIKEAAKFIYLNRTCWNGLYRVNLEGEFNVPIGTKENVILGTDNFELISNQLRKVKILNYDFQRIVDMSDKDDFLFVDPPYTVQHNNNGFLKYNEKLFHWDDQVRLRDSLMKAKKRGVKIVLTNADHPSILNLYESDFDIIRVNRISKIAAKAEFRNSCNELIIRSN